MNMKYVKSSALLSIALGSVLVFASFGCGSDESERITELERRLATMEDLYKPGLHSLMNETLHRHSNLWFAGLAENWELADYQHHELEEVFEDIEELHPEYHGEPVALLLGSMMQPSMDEVEEAIHAMSIVRFREAFTNLTNSCNSCHQATGKAMIVITEPDENMVRNLKF
jgi:hypothetical protein